jgi:hypothetical protein
MHADSDMFFSVPSESLWFLIAAVSRAGHPRVAGTAVELAVAGISRRTSNIANESPESTAILAPGI